MILGIFRNRLNDGVRNAYEPVAERMEERVAQIPGFISMKTFAADDGERVTVFQFEDLAAVDAWRADTEHQAAQQQGRAEFYAAYELIVAEVVRSARYAPADDAEQDDA